MSDISIGPFNITLNGLDNGWEGSLSASPAGDGVTLVHVQLKRAESARPPAARLAWEWPIADIHARWLPGAGAWRRLPPDWSDRNISRCNSSAPVISLYNFNGQNRLTFAFSDAMNPVGFRAAVHEENACLKCAIEIFAEPSEPISSYSADLRLDTRDIPFYRSIGDVSAWWAGQPGYEPSPVPDIARQPLYSTWYSFHQRLVPEEVEKQCRLAKELGCEVVIMDDGWQTGDNSRGYEHCGDWLPRRIPDLAGHVSRIHDIGMKFMLWYAVPFIGKSAANYERFEGKYLGNRGENTCALDPRFPDVREFLINTYENAMREWDLDGFKLDFVDNFSLRADNQEFGKGRDYDSVPLAVDRLLADVMTRLRAIKPDVMIEFRQSYIGPLMRKYGNMFRAGDCPNDALSNRFRTTDVRLLCGNTAAHSDMLMWHADEPVESAAMQFVHILFSVPQISVLLDKVPPEHVEMLRFWLKFWRENRDVLLDGEFMPQSPEILYPVICSQTRDTWLAAAYGGCVVDVCATTSQNLILVNGTLRDSFVMRLAHDLGQRELEVRDCRGRIVRQETVRLSPGVVEMTIPPAGVAVLA